jgi:outer membrane protein TolC
LKSSKLKHIRSLAIVALSASLIACGFQTYLPKPIKPQETKNRYEQQTPRSEAFNDYLIEQNYPQSSLPIQNWNLRELSYSALFFHPDLDLARSEWRAAQSSEITASERIDPKISASAGKNTKNNIETSPWTYSLGIEIGIITAGKREARIDRAANLSEAARINIAQKAWQVRTRLAKSLLEYVYSLQQTAALQKEVDLRMAIVEMLEKRVDAGIASNIDLNNARIALQKAQQNLTSEQGRTPGLYAALASDAGLSIQTFKSLNLNLSLLNETSTNAVSIEDNLQDEALLNRLDLRSSLARYQAAESKLRLEIARQYPDLALSPSYAYDQGDKIWSLGIGSIITLLNKNRGLIAEANALRDVEAAQFNVTQAKVISELNQAKATYMASFSALSGAENLVLTQQARTQQTEQQFNAGIADRLMLTSTQLENVIAEQNRLTVRYKFQLARIALEDVIQKPLTTDIEIEKASAKN